MTDITDQNIADASKILGKAALLDPRISAGDKATTMAWAELLAQSGAGLTADDLLPAVTLHYATSRERIMPADVIRIGRDRRRDRMARIPAAGPNPTYPPASVTARKAAIAAAVAQIGRRHDADHGDTFAAAPGPPKAESAATIAAKVARARAAAPPAPMPADDDEVAR